MTSVSNLSFAANNTQATQAKAPKKEVVYVSKNPDATVNATGVVAGTAGMVGGAVLGGTVGVCKLPGGIASAVAGTDYAGALRGSLDGFKNAVASSPELSNLVNTIKGANAPAVGEELITIVGTLSERLNQTFAGDKHAKAVIDKVIDPIIKSINVKSNFRGYGSGIREQIKSPLGQTIMKFIGFNKKTSSIVGGFVGNLAKGITQSVENIKNFTPEEKAAWGDVAKQIKEELKHNPKIKMTGDLGKALSAMCKDFNWITDPLKNMQTTLMDTIKNLNKGLGNAPIKTIGKWSAIGAAVCGTLSTLGWFGLKKGLMTKENEKAIAAQNSAA